MNLKYILNAPIIGNAMSDMPLIDAIHEFVVDEANDMSDRQLALLKLDQVMGEATKLPTAEDVRQYIAFGEE